jgi:hypothetical protein
VSLEIWARHYGAPLDEREIARHYTLTSDDLEIVGRRRGDATRLGYAMLMLYMRWPGRALEAGEVPPAPVLAYVAQQLGVAPAAFADYAHRDQTRREHLVEIRRSHGFRIFDRNAFREVVAFSVPIAQTIIHPGQMADVIVDELRRLQILLPSPSILEAVLRRARQQAEQLTYEVLTNGLLPDTLQGLDDLLARRPGQVATWLSWMRNAPQSPAARNILRLIERLAYIRALGLDRARADMIPALTFDRLADEGSRITPQHLGELNALRRHATLAATGIRLEESLTDATLTMFDKLLGSMARRAENRTRDKALKTVRELQGHLRTLTGSCRLLIDARSKGVDSLAQIEALDWQHFAVAVEQAEVLGRPETVDRTAELIERHRTVKLFVGAFLNAFEFRGAGAVQGSCQRWPSSRSYIGPANGACLIACRYALCRPHGARSSCGMASSIVPLMNYAPCRNYASGCEPGIYGSREAGSFAISTAISYRRRPLRRCARRGRCRSPSKRISSAISRNGAPGSTRRSSR